MLIEGGAIHLYYFEFCMYCLDLKRLDILGLGHLDDDREFGKIFKMNHIIEKKKKVLGSL